MKQLSGLPLGILLVLGFGALLSMPERSALQAEQPAAEPGDDSSAAPQERKKPRGRLTVFYSQVVSGDQREEIYSIQAKYEPEMDALVEKLVELRNQMQAEIKGVLSSDQIERVEELRAEAKQRRAERAAQKDEAE